LTGQVAKSNCSEVSAATTGIFDGFFAVSGILPDHGIQFADSVRRAVTGMDQGLDRALVLPPFQGIRDPC